MNNPNATRWWVDTENVAVVAVECPAADVDAAGRLLRAATHFVTERGAWDHLAFCVETTLYQAGAPLLQDELAALPAATQTTALTALRNYLVYRERRQAWNRQVDQALRAPVPEPSAVPAPPTFQRGDVVDVTLWDITYRGLVTAARQGRLYICTRRGGHWHDPASIAIALVERRGRRKAATLHAWAQAFE